MILQELIDQKLLADQDKEHTISGKFAPSRFGRCFRFQIWKRRGEKETNPPDARVLKIFKMGNLIDKFAKDLIKEANPNAESDVKVEKEDIFGYADVVLNDEVIEVKSQHSRSFWYMEKSQKEGVFEKDKYPNILQLMTYVWILGKEKGRLMFISRDDLCIAEYGFYLNGKWKKEINKELSTLRTYWNFNKLPPLEPRTYTNRKTGKSKECEYCPYKIKCNGKK